MSKNKKVFLTNHSKIRFDERTNYGGLDEQQKRAAKAFKEGHEFSEYKDPVASFLKNICSEQGKYVAKIYKEYVYIFNNCCGHRLLTVYPVPTEYLPTKWCLIPKENLGRCIIALTNKEGKTFYWHECGGLTPDLDEALEFTNQIKATNYINNNQELDIYKDSYDIALF